MRREHPANVWPRFQGVSPIRSWSLGGTHRGGALLKPAKEAYMRPPKPQEPSPSRRGAPALLIPEPGRGLDFMGRAMRGPRKASWDFQGKSANFRRVRDTELR